MTTTAHDLMRERILGACRLAEVATAAGVDAAAWASTTAPRVLTGNRAGYVAGLHRGRLPALEVYQDGDQWDRLTLHGGTMTTTWVLRAHVADLDRSAAESRARAMILVALAAIRSDDYLDEGEEEVGALSPAPLGHVLEARVQVVHAYGRATYETDAVVTPGSPVVAVPGPGGWTADVSYSDAASTVVFAVPDGHALDTIDVHVVQAWDGPGASVRLGNAADADRFFAAADLELDAVGVTFSKDFEGLAGPFAVIATITPGAGASAGLLRVQIAVTAAGV